MYQLVKNAEGVVNQVKRIEDNTYIPFNSDNRDYQQYLKWVAEGNTPLPPDDTGAQS